MCGITGFIADREVPVDSWFTDAIRCVRHRGPDRELTWLRGDAGHANAERVTQEPRSASAALGFARLAIIDLSEASDQPFVEPGRASVVLNGEIYNYIELRDELAARGWQFSSSGDAEVLLKAYLEWGIDALARLNGMFAVAIHDEERGSLILARDRFGEKPLHWRSWRGGIAFASEIKQLARYPGVTLELDQLAAQTYLATGRPYLGFSSWFTGVAQVEPGSWLTCDGNGSVRTGKYFDLRAEVAAVQPERSPAAWADRFSVAFRRSVELRLRSDVSVGTSLSSGVDSSAVLAEAAAIGHGRYHAFTLRYDDERDEGAAAEAMASAAGASWHPVWATADEFARSWDTLTWHHESPIEGGSVFGQWKVFEAAHAAGVRVILDGQGADEVLAGYHKFYASHVLGRVRSVGPLAIADVARFTRQVGRAELAKRLIGAAGFGRGNVSAPTWQHEGPTGPPLSADLLRMRLADIEVWSLPNLLAFADRNSMAHSVETRLPFLDPDVATLGLAMSGDVLYHGGWTKWPLRSHLAGRGAPEAAWRRGKRWFDLPSDSWLQTSLRPALDEFAAQPHEQWESLVAVGDLRTHVNQLRVSRARSAAGNLMVLLALERFFRVWFGHGDVATSTSIGSLSPAQV